MTIEHRMRLADGSDFPATAGPTSGLLTSAVTALGLRVLRRFLPSLGPGRDARPVPFGGEGEPNGRHLRGPP